MPSSLPLRVLRPCLLVLALVAGVASAWDWEQPAPLTPLFTLNPIGLAADSGGFWMSGGALVRYDLDGKVVATQALTETAALHADGEGGVYAANEVPGDEIGAPPQVGCRLDRFAADGRKRWHAEVDAELACDQVVRDGRGAIWVSVGNWAASDQSTQSQALRLHRLDASGVERAALDMNDIGDAVREIAAAPAGGVYAYDGSGLVALDAAMQVRWRRNGSGNGRLGRDAQGRPWLVEANAQGLHIAHYGDDGSPLGEAEVALIPAPSAVVALAILDDGDIAEIDRGATASALTLRRIGADGGLRWSTSLGSDVLGCAAYYGRCVLLQTREGLLVTALRKTPHDGMSVLELVAYDGAGQRRGGTSGSADLVTGFAVLADGSSLLQMHRAGYLLESPPAPAPTLLRLDAQGQPMAAPSLSQTLPFFSTPLSTALTPDGETYLLTQPLLPPAGLGNGDEDLPGRHSVTRLGADGARRWVSDDDGYWTPGAAIAADSAKVCAAGMWTPTGTSAYHLRVACYAHADGQRLWTWQSSTIGTPGTTVVLSASAEGGLGLLLRATPFRYYRFAADGTPLGSTAVDGTTSSSTDVVRTNVQGDVLLFGAARTLSLRADGSTRFRLACSDLGTDVCLTGQDAAAEADGSAVLLGAGNGTWAIALGADGAVQWKTQVLGQFARGQMQDRGDGTLDVILSVPATGPGTTTVARLRRSDGAVLWRNQHAAPLQETLVPTPDPTRVMLRHDENRTVTLRVLDGSDGEELATRVESCFADCLTQDARVGDDGTLRLVNRDSSSDFALTTVVGLRGVAAAGAPVPLDQAALGGAWWNVHGSGQGFMLDVLPDSGTFFLPWFTFGTAEDNRPQGQRWYTVQGSVSADDTQAELGLYATESGAFDAPTNTSTTRVGTALVQFSDCDHGSLHYRFDPGVNQGAEGDISLSRLLPRSAACRLADGSTQGVPVAAPAQGGFDAGLSGSWYEPATAGQGLQFAIVPGATLFAPWFTYTPAQSADAGSQRWLSLQGSLAGAQNGSAEVTIAMALGGRLDGGPTGNQFAVGSATVHVLACDRMQVDYRFDDTEQADVYRGRAGTLDLVKIGGCSP